MSAVWGALQAYSAHIDLSALARVHPTLQQESVLLWCLVSIILATG